MSGEGLGLSDHWREWNCPLRVCDFSRSYTWTSAAKVKRLWSSAIGHVCGIWLRRQDGSPALVIEIEGSRLPPFWRGDILNGLLVPQTAYILEGL